MSKSNIARTQATQRSDRGLFIVMLIGGVLALAAAFVLSLEKIHLLQNPNATLSCSFNLVLNCSTVMQTWQSSVFFGIPNMYIGLMAFPVVVTVAVAGLSGTTFPRRFMMVAHIGYLLGTVFAYWLFFQSVYAIQVLCPWCLIVTFSCTLLFAAQTQYALRHNIYQFNKKHAARLQAFLDAGYHKLVVAAWIILMIALVLLKFGSDLFA